MALSLEAKLIAGALALAALLAGFWGFVHHEREVGAAKVIAVAAAAASAAEAKATQETERRVAVQSENLDEFHRLQDRSIADGASLDRAAAGVVGVLHASAVGGGAAGHPAAAGPGEACRPVPGTACVPADVLEQLVGDARQAAKWADCLASAGQLCADDYGALRP